MPIQLYNTLTRQKELFKPIDSQNVRMYVCGPTIYDHPHLGNAVPVVIFDLLYRLLKYHYPKVTYARNITDVDDKIMTRAEAEGVPISAITQKYEVIYNQEMSQLGVLSPDIIPHATQHIGEMIAMIETLIAKGNAYVVTNAGNQAEVLFHVPSMPSYGRLSRNLRDELIAGARVDVVTYKKDPADFTLWKPSTPEQPGWDSPWGYGRPGWHIECSAMSAKHLGESFDIHGGGNDLTFPHHENEIAQSECAHGHVMANYWIHNGMLMIDGRKMSKSLGNFHTVRDLLAIVPGEVMRFFIMKTHYASPMDFTFDALKAAKQELDGLYRRMKAPTEATEVDKSVLEALNDNLNTPLAIAALHQVSDENLRASASIIGILQQNPTDWFKWQPEGSALSEGDIDAQIAARNDARITRNFAESDRIRDALLAQGIVLEDKAGETTWRRQ